MATAFRALRLVQRAPIARQMPVSRIASALPRTYATATVREATPNKPVEQAEQASEDLSDPNMNGNYPDPSTTSALPLKRQFRDPRAEWWDPQERRNYGEPVHEVRILLQRHCLRQWLTYWQDNDVLGIFTTEAYTHVTPGWGLVLIVSTPTRLRARRQDVLTKLRALSSPLSAVCWRSFPPTTQTGLPFLAHSPTASRPSLVAPEL